MTTISATQDHFSVHYTGGKVPSAATRKAPPAE